MHGKHLYEYSVVRYVPDVSRQEFINVGIIMMCKRQSWIRFFHTLPMERILPFRPPHTAEEINEALEMFRQVAETGQISYGAEIMLPEERFRWITAVKSCALQTSRPHPGFTDNLDETFEKLIKEQVL